MSTKYLGEKMTRDMLFAILSLIRGTARYTSREITAILANDYPVEAVRPQLYRLTRQGYLAGGAYGGYCLTSKGQKRLEALHFEELSTSSVWDGKWRLVIYDIPEEHRKARDTIRRLIKKLGFIQVQQSVWAHPLPCLEEFELLREAYGVKKHLLLLEVMHSEDYARLLKLFQAKYPDIC